MEFTNGKRGKKPVIIMIASKYCTQNRVDGIFLKEVVQIGL